LYLRQTTPRSRLLHPWPVVEPDGWVNLVNEPIAQAEAEKLNESIVRSRPFGSSAWQEQTARRLGLEASLRDPWRPKKQSR
jgi:hypothetical protein